MVILIIILPQLDAWCYNSVPDSTSFFTNSYNVQHNQFFMNRHIQLLIDHRNCTLSNAVSVFRNTSPVVSDKVCSVRRCYTYPSHFCALTTGQSRPLPYFVFLLMYGSTLCTCVSFLISSVLKCLTTNRVLLLTALYNIYFIYF